MNSNQFPEKCQNLVTKLKSHHEGDRELAKQHISNMLEEEANFDFLNYVRETLEEEPQWQNGEFRAYSNQQKEEIKKNIRDAIGETVDLIYNTLKDRDYFDA